MCYWMRKLGEAEKYVRVVQNIYMENQKVIKKTAAERIKDENGRSQIVGGTIIISLNH